MYNDQAWLWAPVSEGIAQGPYTVTVHGTLSPHSPRYRAKVVNKSATVSNYK